MRRALHPLLAMRGWTREEGGILELEPVTAEQMIDWAGAGRGRRPDPVDRVYETRVVEILERVALAVTNSVPYMEYLHLIKTDEGWKIHQRPLDATSLVIDRCRLAIVPEAAPTCQ